MILWSGKAFLAFGTANRDFAFISGHPELGLTMGAGNHPVIHQIKNSLFIQADDHVIADEDSGHAADVAAGQLISGLGIDVDVLLHKLDMVLPEKILGGFAMGTGLSRHHNDIFHFISPSLVFIFV